MSREVNVLRCKIDAIEYHLPDTVVDNRALASRYAGWSEEKIYEKTGIRQRHVVNSGEHVSHLAVHAGQKLIEKGAVDPGSVEMLVLCTQTPEFALPATSHLIHQSLGLPEKCLVFDFNQGCTGFIYGLSIAGSMIHSGLVRNALFITSETYSRWCHPGDKSTATIFGDAAAAIFLSHAEAAEGIGPFAFGSDGRGFHNLIVPHSGSHQRSDTTELEEKTDSSGNIRTAAHLYMNGPELFRFAMSVVPRVVRDVLTAAHDDLENIDKFVFHQANAYMLKSLQKTLKIPDEKMIYELEDTGNTVSSSIPIALKRAYEKGVIQKGDRLLLVGFGVGYSWGAVRMNWNPL